MRKKLVLLASVLLMGLGSGHAGRLVTDSLQSQVLGAVRHYNVYLPNGYEKETDRQYPVLYLLHGLSDTHTGWEKNGRMKIVIDELIGSGECVPMIVIMPEAGGQPTSTVWNGYFNMEGWPYERFFFEEFLPHVEKKYRIIGDKEHRAVSGLSMGGGGSVVYCQRHPELFSSCYALSGWLDQAVSDEMRKNTTSKHAIVSCSVHDHSAIEFLRKADDATKQKLRTVHWFIDCGDDDFLLEVNEDFHREMRRAGIPCEFRVRNGVHNWEYWHTGLRWSLPFVSRNFGK